MTRGGPGQKTQSKEGKKERGNCDSSVTGRKSVT